VPTPGQPEKRGRVVIENRRGQTERVEYGVWKGKRLQGGHEFLRFAGRVGRSLIEK